LSFVQAVLAERIPLQLHAAEALPTLRAIWPLTHPSAYEGLNVNNRSRSRRNADRHAGRDNRIDATGGFSLAQFSISGAVHFDSAIGRRHF
jgi:hypothetical protein